MKKTAIHLFIPIIVFLLFICHSEGDSRYSVRWVEDGDTIVLADDRHIRYIGINAPEIEHDDQKAEPYGYEAKQFNEKLISSRKVRLEFDRERIDQYGRLLAYVFLEDNTLVNQAMIENGYAHCLPKKPNDRYETAFLKAQRRAMTKRLGIWRLLKKESHQLVGNRRSKRFHLQTCPFGKKTSKKNRILFSNQREAFWAGFAPCRKCQ
jgi:endonuclease YncB( thermonuclease family)